MERMRYRAVRSPLRRGASMFKDSNRFSSFFAVSRAFSRIVVCIPQMNLVSAFGALIRIWTAENTGFQCLRIPKRHDSLQNI